MKILVIEDEVVLRESLADYLEDRGFQVLMRENGRSGIEAFKQEKPDLVLTDLRMPEVDGLEVLRSVGSMAPDIPLIVVSGTGRISDSVHALQLGAWDYILKPVEDMAVISHAIERALERSRLRLENRRYQQRLEGLVRERTIELEAANTNLGNINARLRKVVSTANRLSVCSDVAKFGQTLLEEFAKQMAASGGSLYLVETGGLRLLHALDPEHLPSFISFPLKERCIFERVLREQRPLLIDDIDEEQMTRGSGWNGYKNGSALAFPLPDENDRIVGLLTLHNKAAPPFVEQDFEIGAILASFSCETLRATRTMESLRVSEERFRELVEMLPEAVFESDHAMKITFANRRATELFGHTKHQFENDLYCLDLITPGNRHLVEASSIDCPQKAPFKATELRGLKRDGSSFPMLMHSNPIDSGGASGGFRCIAVDITELIRLREEKSSLEEQYHQAQKVESIGRLAGGVAHDLNNLLSPILGFSEMLQGDLEQNDERRESVDEILKAGRRAEDLVKQLLAFSRKQELRYRPVDPSRAVANIHKLLRRTIREDVNIETVLDDDVGVILADVGQIEQVVMNLSVNAQDAMPAGGTLTVEVDHLHLDDEAAATSPGLAPGRYARLAVSDTGYGMDSETLSKIFEPFFSTKGAFGTGLGLATVHGIVKQHGGCIRVHSEPDAGTRFTILFPSSTEPLVEQVREQSSPRDLMGTETILLVEDDDQVRQLGQAILERHGYNVLHAESGIEALKTSREYDGTIDLLLTDVIMPEMNGRELSELIIEERPGLQVLFMSGYTDDVIAQRGILEEGSEMIQKPFSVPALASKLRDVLEKN